MSKLLTLRSDSEQINAYLNGKGTAQLSDALAAKLDRLQIVANLIGKYKSTQRVAGQLVKLWPGECCLGTAYNLIREAQEVFAPAQLHERALYVDMLLDDNQRNRAMAVELQDLKTVAACDKLQSEIISKHMGTNAAFPIDKIQPPRFVFSNDGKLVSKGVPDNIDALVAGIVKTRKVGIVADHPDFEDAKVLDESKPPGAA